jgi:hypothetical protein
VPKTRALRHRLVQTILLQVGKQYQRGYTALQGHPACPKPADSILTVSPLVSLHTWEPPSSLLRLGCMNSSVHLPALPSSPQPHCPLQPHLPYCPSSSTSGMSPPSMASRPFLLLFLLPRALSHPPTQHILHIPASLPSGLPSFLPTCGTPQPLACFNLSLVTSTIKGG